MSMAEVERLIATAREGLDVAERPLRERLDAARIACLIELIYGSGLRVSEALSLKKIDRDGQVAAHPRARARATRSAWRRSQVPPAPRSARFAPCSIRSRRARRRAPGCFPPRARAAT